MKIKLNGQVKNYDISNPTILDILTFEKVKIPEYVSVQVNGTFALSKDYGSTKIAENDELDFLYFMGGGAGSRTPCLI